MNHYQMKIPGCVYGGVGSLSQLPNILQKESASHVSILTDPGVRGAGLCDPVVDLLKKNGTSYHIIDSLVSEPSAEDVECMLLETDPSAQLIIAVGGGSVMDAAKLAAVLKDASYTVRDLVSDPGLAKKQIRCVMIPTTCGTGSEATCNAIVALPEQQLKVGIVSDAMIPDYVILDPAMIAALPPTIIAATGVDALAHCVECFTSNKANPFSDLYAAAGARLIFSSLLQAYQNPADMDAKSDLLLGAFYGGIAITSSGTTAVHALSYPLGGKFHIPHGISNAILFAPVMEYNKPACRERLAALCDQISPSLLDAAVEDKAKHLLERIAEVVTETNIPTTLESFGVSEGDLDFLTAAASKVTRLLDNNMRKLDLDDIRSIYQQVL